MLYTLKSVQPYKYPEFIRNKYKARELGLTYCEFIEKYEDESPEEIHYVFSTAMPVFVSVLSPKSYNDYMIMFHHELKNSMVFTEDELRYVKLVLDKNNIVYTVYGVENDNALIALTAEEEKESFTCITN